MEYDFYLKKERWYICNDAKGFTMGCSGNNAKYTTLEGCQPHIRKILKENTTYFLRNEYFFDESEQWVRRVFYIVLHFFIIHWMGKHMDANKTKEYVQIYKISVLNSK